MSEGHTPDMQKEGYGSIVVFIIDKYLFQSSVVFLYDKRWL